MCAAETGRSQSAHRLTNADLQLLGLVLVFKITRTVYTSSLAYKLTIKCHAGVGPTTYKPPAASGPIFDDA